MTTDRGVSRAGSSDQGRRSQATWLVACLTMLGACGLQVGGVPVACQGNIDDAECAARAEGVLTHSLESAHPSVSRIVVTCDADLCDADQGSGQVIVHFANGEREIVDIGFGRTN